MKGKLIKTEGSYILKDGLLQVIGVDDKNLKERLNRNYLLSTKNCQAIERGYDLDKLADEYYRKLELVPYKSNSFKAGFQKALELMEHRLSKETEWDVEVEMTKEEYIWTPPGEGFEDQTYRDWREVSRLDADGCLILKRI